MTTEEQMDFPVCEECGTRSMGDAYVQYGSYIFTCGECGADRVCTSYCAIGARDPSIVEAFLDTERTPEASMATIRVVLGDDAVAGGRLVLLCHGPHNECYSRISEIAYLGGRIHVSWLQRLEPAEPAQLFCRLFVRPSQSDRKTAILAVKRVFGIPLAEARKTLDAETERVLLAEGDKGEMRHLVSLLGDSVSCEIEEDIEDTSACP